MKKWIMLTLMLGLISVANSKRVKIKYEKNQQVDLGALAVDGEIVAPGDISVTDEESWESNSLFKRKHYKDKFKKDIKMAY
jgi:hypothetical protein